MCCCCLLLLFPAILPATNPVLSAPRQLHEEEFGLDAVLLAEGGHVGAHCAVLAAASPFLKSLLLDATDHPAIISVTGRQGEARRAPRCFSLSFPLCLSPRLLLRLAARQ